MFDEISFWKKRFVASFKEYSAYLKYILNGHLMIVLLFLIGTAAYYYQGWVKGLPSDFPSALLMAFIMGIFLTIGHVYTFLVEADTVFLLPLERKMGGYFRRSLLASFVLQAYIITLVLAVLMPMYAQVNISRFGPFFYFLFFLLMVKLINLFVRWKMQYFVERRTHGLDIMVRYFLNIGFAYLLFTNAETYYVIIILLIFLGLALFFHYQVKGRGIKWEILISLEEKRKASFYRIANMFTDVPHLRDQVRRRKWLDWIYNQLPYRQERTYSHLFWRAFIRSGDYLGIWIRLTAIGSLAIYFIHVSIVQLVFSILFLYLTGFQLIPLGKYYENKLWLNLYPVTKTTKHEAVRQLLLVMLTVQSVIFAFLVLLQGQFLLFVVIAISCILSTKVMVKYFLTRIDT